jgi:hypothetical protein
MEKLMSKKVLMGAGLVLVAFLVYKSYTKKQADAKKAEELRIQQSAKPAR